MSREIYQINSKEQGRSPRTQDIQKRAGLGILFLRTGPLVELQASTQARWVSSEKSGLVSWCLHLLPDGEALTKPFSWGDGNF